MASKILFMDYHDRRAGISRVCFKVGLRGVGLICFPVQRKQEGSSTGIEVLNWKCN